MSKPAHAHAAWDDGPMRTDVDLTRQRMARDIRTWRRTGVRVHRYPRPDGVAFVVQTRHVSATVIFVR